MYRELITELAKDNKWVKQQEPCHEEEIEKAEKYVGYPFPEELKDLFRETNGDHWLLLSIEQIMDNVKRNREILAEIFDDIDEFNEKVDRHIFFATNGCGDYYCYRVMASGEVDASAIYIWEHETNETHFVANNIPELIRRYYNSEI